MYSGQLKYFSVHSIINIRQWADPKWCITKYNLNGKLKMFTVYCTVGSVHFTLYTVECTVETFLSNFTIQMVKCTLYVVYGT